MREILFRGQTRKNGEKVEMATGEKVPGHWVYGGIFPGTGDYSIIYGGETEKDLERHVVYSETVGQYTGLTDKNGRRIFEGDIVRYTFDSPDDPTATENGLKVRTGRIFWSDWRASFSVTAGRNLSTAINNDVAVYVRGRQVYEYVRGANTVEVIGNIHDNPEMLKGGEG